MCLSHLVAIGLINLHTVQVVLDQDPYCLLENIIQVLQCHCNNEYIHLLYPCWYKGTSLNKHCIEYSLRLPGLTGIFLFFEIFLGISYSLRYFWVIDSKIYELCTWWKICVLMLLSLFSMLLHTEGSTSSPAIYIKSHVKDKYPTTV